MRKSDNKFVTLWRLKEKDAMSAILRSPLPYLLILTLLACAPKPRQPLPHFYDRLAEPLDTLDVSSVAGKRIVIDPGHGGVFRGAIGVEGLDEADVNLGVALYLWGLLEEAGAEVHLTRKTDRDFVGGDPDALRQDLEPYRPGRLHVAPSQRRLRGRQDLQ